MTYHQEASSDVQVGSRVSCSGHRGTVKYVGSVAPFEGAWLGVDWDDPSRGKHDGSHNGVKYFHTRHPTSGSFVRPGKVLIGQSITQAISERYGAVEDEMAGVNKAYLESLKHEIKARFVEVVGFDKVNKKQSHFEDLTIVSVDNLLVNNAGPPGQLQGMCPNVTELDLARNLLSTWESIAEIAVQLEHLQSLTVSENILTVPNNPKGLQDNFKALKCVFAAKMEYGWPQMLQCAMMWPELEMLKIPKNNISKLQTPPVNVLRNLRVLDLEGNCIEDWEEIKKLGSLPSLRQLNVCDTGISKIQFPPGEKTDLFPSLSWLVISENNIQEWESISELNKLKCIEDLRIRKNPVLALESWETACQIVIARIANLKVLNGQQVCEERRGAEYDYLKKYALEWINLSSLATSEDKESQVQKFLQMHPRFPELIAKYGLPEHSELKKMPETIQENVITVKLTSPNFPGKTIEKVLFPGMDVIVLQGLVKKIFKVRKTPKLSYFSSKKAELIHEMPFITRNIYFYGVEDGDTIIATW